MEKVAHIFAGDGWKSDSHETYTTRQITLILTMKNTNHINDNDRVDTFNDQARLLCEASLRQELHRAGLLCCKDLSGQVDHTGNTVVQLKCPIRVGQISQRMSCTKEGKILCQPGWRVSDLRILYNIPSKVILYCFVSCLS